MNYLQVIQSFKNIFFKKKWDFDAHKQQKYRSRDWDPIPITSHTVSTKAMSSSWGEVEHTLRKPTKQIANMVKAWESFHKFQHWVTFFIVVQSKEDLQVDFTTPLTSRTSLFLQHASEIVNKFE